MQGIVLEAGRRLKDAFYSQVGYDVKPDRTLVTALDVEIEDFVKRAVLEWFPDDGFIGEESEGVEGKSGRVWVLDPLDGTTNFIMHLPFFAVSLALKEKGKTKCAFVYNPVLNELFWAEKGRSFLWDKEIRAGEGLKFAGICYTNITPCLGYLKRLGERGIRVRKFGAASLELCYVGWGRLDAFVGFNLKPGDFEAAAYILKSAGGLVEEEDGLLIAANTPKTLEEIRALLR